jgi:hypothetical protein
MKLAEHLTEKRLVPSTSSIVWAYILAAGFLGSGFYFTRLHPLSVSPVIYILGGVWLGRAIEKTSLWWKLSQSPPHSVQGTP